MSSTSNVGALKTQIFQITLQDFGRNKCLSYRHQQYTQPKVRRSAREACNRVQTDLMYTTSAGYIIQRTVLKKKSSLKCMVNCAEHFAPSTAAVHLVSNSNNPQLLFTSAAVGISFASAYGDLTGNHVFMCAFWSWLIAQVAKVFTAYYRESHWDYKVMFDSGGMPSSHTALVVGLTTSIAHQYGLGSVHFPLALAFTLIVMYDAAGVRRHAGKQAEVLNKILADTFHASPISDTKLKEVLGHSPLQVVCGAVLGVVVGSCYMLKFSY